MFKIVKIYFYLKKLLIGVWITLFLKIIYWIFPYLKEGIIPPKAVKEREF